MSRRPKNRPLPVPAEEQRQGQQEAQQSPPPPATQEEGQAPPATSDGPPAAEQPPVQQPPEEEQPTDQVQTGLPPVTQDPPDPAKQEPEFDELARRYNNPAILVQSASQWRGLTPDQPYLDDVASFVEPIYGVRALARILIGSKRRGKATSLADIAGRLAASVGHDHPPTFRADLEAQLGAPLGTPRDLGARAVLLQIVPAIMTAAVGTCTVGPQQIADGVDLALMKP